VDCFDKNRDFSGKNNRKILYFNQKWQFLGDTPSELPKSLLF